MREAAQALVFAIGHEVGNLLAAVRLQAHLLDEEAGGKALAAAAVAIEDLAHRAGALLGLVRPLLEGGFASGASADPAECLDVVRAETAGWARAARLEVTSAPGLPLARAEARALHPLLLTWLAGALEAAGPRGRVRLAARAEADRVVFELEDDGPAPDDPAGWLEGAPRGRALGLQAAARLAAPVGGTVHAAREGDATRLRVELPVAGRD